VYWPLAQLNKEKVTLYYSGFSNGIGYFNYDRYPQKYLTQRPIDKATPVIKPELNCPTDKRELSD